METLLVAIVSGLASFVGNMAANRVHMHYLRRDVDRAHERMDEHERDFNHQRREVIRA